jgi:MtaA/CmuA family methyltransferase
MNGFERIAAAMRGEWPDTVPVMLHNFMMAAREAGVTMAQFRSDPQLLARSFIQAVERYGYDGIMIDVDTVTLAGAAGVPIDFPPDEPARVAGRKLESLEAAAELSPVNILDYPPVEVWLEAVRLLKHHFGDEIYIRGNCDQCPFTLASLIRGMDDWLVDLMDPQNEAMIHRLLEFCTEITSQFIRQMSSTGAHMLSNGDSVAGPELVSPSIFRRFALPYARGIVDLSHKLGLPYVLHICGNTGLIIDDMIATGADGLELDYKTDPGQAHLKMKDRLVFVGNIDPSAVLARGTPEIVRERTLDLLNIFRDSPRFILNAGCAIPPTTPSSNLQALMRTAREFRR